MSSIRVVKSEEGAEENIEKKAVNDTIKWHNIIRGAIDIFALMIIVIFLFVLIKQKTSSIIFVVILPVCLEYLTGVYLSVGIVGKVVKTNGSNIKLTNQEISAINILACVLWFFDICYGPEQILKFAIRYPDTIISDLLMIFFCVLLCFIYIFFICSILLIPITKGVLFVRDLCENMSGKEKTKEFEVFLENWNMRNAKRESCLIGYIESIVSKNRFIKVIGCWLIPIIFMLDIITVLVSTCISILFSMIKNVIILLGLILQTLKRIINWIIDLSDKRIVAISFRIALIIALIITVGVNRYTPFLKEYEASTALLEFVASSIIIPMIFEWISRFNRNKVK